MQKSNELGKTDTKRLKEEMIAHNPEYDGPMGIFTDMEETDYTDITTTPTMKGKQ